MKVLVTGSSGVAGRALKAMASQFNHEFLFATQPIVIFATLKPPMNFCLSSVRRCNQFCSSQWRYWSFGSRHVDAQR